MNARNRPSIERRKAQDRKRIQMQTEYQRELARKRETQDATQRTRELETLRKLFED